MKRALSVITVFLLPLLLQSAVCGQERSLSVTSTRYPADISYLTIDLKFNWEKGVQICEIQQGMLSRFEGYDYLHNQPGLAAANFCQALSVWERPVLYYPGDFADRGFLARFAKEGYIALKGQLSSLAIAAVPTLDRSSIESYQGIYFGFIAHFANSYEEFTVLYPGILPTDAPFEPLYRDKLSMNALFAEDPGLQRYKPKCGAFEKKYTPALANQILDEIGSDTVVIKPINTFKGKGVIIVDKKDLDSTLKYIFSNSKKLKKDPDPSYNWWWGDQNSQFLIEEFVASDPVFVPHLNNKPYDGTMRVGAILTYHEGEISYQCTESHWKLPLKSLTEKGTLNDTHKSNATPPRYALVSDEVQAEIDLQLGEALLLLYKKLLTEG